MPALIIAAAKVAKVGYLLVVTFASGADAAYTMQNKASCESAKPAVVQLYKDLRSDVVVTCMPRTNAPESAPDSQATKTSIKTRTTYRPLVPQQYVYRNGHHYYQGKLVF